MLNGERFTFDVFGLYNGLFVMKDRQTDSVWSHFEGRALTGPMANQGAALELEPVIQTTWGEWVSLHPKTDVLDWLPAFENRYREIVPGRPGLSEAFRSTIVHFDDRLAENTLVLGVEAGDAWRAYRLGASGGGLTIIEDRLGGIPLLVVLAPDSSFGAAYRAELEGAPLDFFLEDGAIHDSRGNLWSIEGIAVDGPDEARHLAYVASFITEWYGWSAYHPETTIYGYP